jgi:hypothetical protein
MNKKTQAKINALLNKNEVISEKIYKLSEKYDQKIENFVGQHQDFYYHIEVALTDISRNNDKIKDILESEDEN